jgi:hypothetical protein
VLGLALQGFCPNFTGGGVLDREVGTDRQCVPLSAQDTHALAGIGHRLTSS